MADPRIGVDRRRGRVGSRLGAASPKAFVRLSGRSLLTWSSRRRCGCPGGRVCHRRPAPPGHVSEADGRPTGMRGRRSGCVPGGAERPDSVAAGLAALPADVDVVLVHDAARALTPSALFAGRGGRGRRRGPRRRPGTRRSSTRSSRSTSPGRSWRPRPGPRCGRSRRPRASAATSWSAHTRRRAPAGDRRRRAGRGARPAGPRRSRATRALTRSPPPTTSTGSSPCATVEAPRDD